MNYELSQMVSESATSVSREMVPLVRKIDELILNIYDDTLDSVIKHVSLEEFQDLNEDITKLKGIKGY